MKVFKFGGASINSIERIQNLKTILDGFAEEPLMIIISAMSKTTNALEKMVESFYAEKKEEALKLWELIKNQHLTTAKYVLVTHFNSCIEQLNNLFTEVEWLLNDKPHREFDYYYDQIVCVGELLSSSIVSHFLNEAGINNKWIDVRDILRTDDNFRDANVDWNYTLQKANQLKEELTANSMNQEREIKIQQTTDDKQQIPPDRVVRAGTNIILTQGFVGATDENESTTLGREGSDFTAAIFANLLDAESLTIWKDVEGVMSADPKQFPDAQFINELSFDEVIEMAYYGAQVIHPKTIKPLQNKGIPLYVKCFLYPTLPGTVIFKKQMKLLPPIVIVKENQVLMHLHSQDFSFVGEKPMSRLYEIFGHIMIRPNLIQTGAVSLQVCLDDKSDKIDQLAAEASTIFDVQVERGLTLLTIRHFTKELLDTMVSGKETVLIQETKETVQVLYR
jgi:aspartate kinase